MGDTARQHLGREQAYEYEMVVKEPRLRVSTGEIFSVATEDSTNGSIRSVGQLPVSEVLGPQAIHRQFNPCAGPIFVTGARPGDVLAVRIHDIEVDQQGVNCFFPDHGPLADSAAFPECRGPYTKIIRHLPGPSGTTSDGTAVLDQKTQWPLQPHIGTIGTVPDRPVAAGSDTLFGQTRHGGNMDCRDICAGSVVLLPVAVEGAFLYLGDVHGTMADGEFIGNADECRALVTLSCEVVAQKSIPWVRVETPDAIIQLNSYRPLEASVKQAFLWLMGWLMDDYGFTAREAYLHLGLNPGVRIRVYQLVDDGRFMYTSGVSFPRSSLPLETRPWP